MCRKLNSEFMSFELRTGAFSAFIDRLTPTTQIMIVIADPTIGIHPILSYPYFDPYPSLPFVPLHHFQQYPYPFPFAFLQVYRGPVNCAESAATMMNLAVARKHFEKLEKWEISDSTIEKSKRNGIAGGKGKNVGVDGEVYPLRTVGMNKYG